MSLYVLCYEHSAYVQQAVRAALAQTYSPLEIVISDDASIDDTFEKIHATVADYRGPHVVKIRRNTQNLGIGEHINQVWRECRGEWIFASAGDDMSHPDRVAIVMRASAAHPEIKLFQSYLREVDARGSVIGINVLGDNPSEAQRIGLRTWGFAQRIRNETPHPHGASFAYSRKVVDLFGPLRPEVIFEDNVLNWRAELLGGMALIREAVVDHRIHEGQITNSAGNVDLERNEIRRRARLHSNVATSIQNMEDAICAFDHGLLTTDELKLLRAWTSDRNQYFSSLRDALVLSWPARIFSLVQAMQIRGVLAPLRRDDFARAMMPDWLYFQLKRGRRRRSADTDGGERNI